MPELKDSNEQKHKRVGMLVSGGFHVLLLILFIFILAWKEPYPPIPQYGIELSFIDNNSSGRSESVSDAQQDTENEVQENQTEDSSDEQVVEEVTEPSSEESSEIENSEEIVEEVATENTDAVEDIETEVYEDVESPDVVEETETPVQETEEVAEEENTPIGNVPTAENSEGEAKEEAKEPTLDSRAIYTGSSGSSSSAESSAGGASLDLSGWIWDFEPEPDDDSDESGKIVFQIIVDNEGEIIGINTIEKSVSPVVEKKYKQAVMDLTFSKTTENSSVAATSTGKITFIIQSK